MVFRFAGTPPTSTEEMEDAESIPLGSAADVRAGISSVLPQTSWSNPEFGSFDGDEFSIEFNLGTDDPIDNMMLHVRGGGDAVSAVMSIVAPLGWSALDCSTGEFLNTAAPSNDGWEGFQNLRDNILGRSDEPEI